MPLNILHIANVKDAAYSGVAVVVPKYLENQSSYVNTALLNVSSADTKSLNSSDFPVLKYKKGLRISSIKSPFNKPDLVVFHEVYHPQFLSLSKELRRTGVPYVITPHVSLTNTAQRHKRLKKMAGNLFLFNSFIRGARSIHYLSESEKTQSSAFASINSFICGNGIDITGRKKKSFPNNSGANFIYVGRLEIKIKGLDRIIEATNLARAELRDLGSHITIRGYDEANNLEWLRSKVHEYRIEDLVSIGGPLFGDDKINEILANDIFIQLSRTEGQPLSLMEAMDIGMPCMVTSGTTFYEHARDLGVGIHVSDNLNDIAASLVEYSKLSSPDLEKISKRASSYIADNYNWNKIAAEMIDAYKRILSERVGV